MAKPVVTKEYVEDLGERDEDGVYDYAYRYWNYHIDLDGRTYRARIYLDEPDEANVMHVDGRRRAEYDDDLRTIGAYLHREAGVRTVLTLAASGGFEPVLTLD